MKIYNYKTGKAVFINNVKTEISEDVAMVLERRPCFPKQMYEDLELEHVTFVRDSDETTLKLAENTTVERFVVKKGDWDFDVTFLLYNGSVFSVYGDYNGQDAGLLRQFDLNQVYNEFKNFKI